MPRVNIENVEDSDEISNENNSRSQQSMVQQQALTTNCFFMMPTPMCTKDTLADYLRYFQRFVTCYQIEDKHAANILATMLIKDSGDATWLEGLSIIKRSSFKHILAEFENREKPHRQAFVLELLECKYKNKLVDDYRAKVDHLTTKCYGGLTKAQLLTALKLDLFINGLPNSLRMAVLNSKPQCIDDAISAVKIAETAANSSSSRHDSHKEAIKSTRNRNITCHYCQLKGHIERECRRKERDEKEKKTRRPTNQQNGSLAATKWHRQTVDNRLWFNIAESKWPALFDPGSDASHLPSTEFD